MSGRGDAVAFSVADTELILVSEMHELFVTLGIDILELQVYCKAANAIHDTWLEVRRVAQLAIGTKACVGAAHAVHPVTRPEGFAGSRQAFDDDFVLAQFGSRVNSKRAAIIALRPLFTRCIQRP